MEESITLLDQELAYWLARTPGALLTSIGGLGITLAAGWTVELGPPSQWRAVRHLLKKWKDKADLKDVFAPEHPLGQWRKMARELYALELRLPQQRAAPSPSASAP